MLLTSDVLSERNVWFLVLLEKAGSLKMESKKTESTVKEGPKNSCREDSSGSSVFGTRPVKGTLADLGRGFGYSLDAV